jgi:hypothetical protein
MSIAICPVPNGSMPAAMWGIMSRSNRPQVRPIKGPPKSPTILPMAGIGGGRLLGTNPSLGLPKPTMTKKKRRELKEKQAEIAVRIEQHQQGDGEYRTTPPICTTMPHVPPGHMTPGHFAP